MPLQKPENVSDEEITRLRDVVLRWVDARKAPISADPATRSYEQKIERQKPTPQPTRKKHLGIKKRVTIFMWLALGAAATVIGSLTGLYFIHFDGSIVRAMTRVIPIPAAVVNTDVVLYYDWITQTHSLKTYYSHVSSPEQSLSSDEIKQYVLRRLIEQQLVKQLAKRYTVTVTPEEINKQTDVLIAETDSRESLVLQIHDLFGWTIEEFQQSVIKPLLLRNKLALALTLDDRLNHDARISAENLLEQIRKGTDTFEYIASRYSQDISAVQGGDLGYFRLGDMVPEFSQALNSMQPGEISNVVKTRFGYHIIKLVEVLKSDDGEELIRAKHILIRSKSIDQYLFQLRSQSTVIQLVVLK